MKQAILFGAYFACATAFAGADREYFWFKNEPKCADAIVKVRSYCEVTFRPGAVIQSNSMCTAQEIRIARPGKKPIRQNLPCRQDR